MVDHESELLKHSRDQEATTTATPTKEEWAEFLKRFQPLEDTIPMIRDYLSKSESETKGKHLKTNNDGEDVLEEHYSREEVVDRVVAQAEESSRKVGQERAPSREAGGVVAKPEENSIKAKGEVTQFEEELVEQPQEQSELRDEMAPQSEKAIATEGEHVNRAESRHPFNEEMNGKQSGDKVAKMTSGKAKKEPQNQATQGAKQKKKKS